MKFPFILLLFFMAIGCGKTTETITVKEIVTVEPTISSVQTAVINCYYSGNIELQHETCDKLQIKVDDYIKIREYMGRDLCGIVSSSCKYIYNY